MRMLLRNIKNRLLRFARNDVRFARNDVWWLSLSKPLNFALFALFALLFASCDVGLGEEVDLSAPILTITSHSDNDTVPSEFTLIGTASDNEEVTSILIDFESQNLHYKVTPGSSWYKKTTSSNNSWVQVESAKSSCEKNGSTWTWTLFVNANEGNLSGTTYNLSASASDKMGNSSKNSKIDISLIMDQNNPNVSIYSPELLTGAYSAISTEAATYALCDGNVISKLFNGDLTFSGRQEGSISFKELRIEFDNGKLSSGTRMVTGDAETSTSVDSIAESVKFDSDSEDLTVYYSKTYKTGENGISDLRNFKFTINQSDWVTEERNSELLSLGTETGAGKLIRVVATSLSDSLAWEKKVIGWFVWWPEADKPWIQTYIGDDKDNGDSTTSVYPSANFVGTAQDDDGIKSLVYSIEKKVDNNWTSYTEETSISLSDEGTKYSAFSIITPSANGIYKITITVTDIYGTATTEVKYFKTLDITAPKFNITTPKNNSSVLADSSGNITFSGIVYDDGSVKSLSMIWLDPRANNDQNNIIRYMSGNESEWDSATTSGVDSDEYSYTYEGETINYTNKIYKIDLGTSTFDDTEKVTKYSFSKTLNIFTDLGITGIAEADGSVKRLLTQYFVLRAVDNSDSKTVLQYSLLGDSETPSLEISSIQQFDGSGNSKIDEFTFIDTSVPTLAAVSSSDYAILKGTWSDNSVMAWGNTTYVNLTSSCFSFGDAEVEIISQTLNSDGSYSWEAKLTNLPKSSKSLIVSLSDLAGNTKTVTKSIFVETAELGLESIGATNSDGSYNSGTIEITLDFTKNTTVDTTSGTPTLTLNNGGTATYTSGSGTAQHIFTYTIGTSGEDTVDSSKNKINLDVTSFNSNGAVYTDASVTGGKEFTVELPTENEKTLAGSRNIIIDQTAPKISSFTVISSSGYYNADKTIIFLLSFDENVTISGASSLGLSFTNITSPNVTASASGSNIIFTYVVTSGENSTNALTINSVVNTTSVTVKDVAGNTLSDWTLPSSTLNNEIFIDTTAPTAPSINAGWGTAALVTSATSFTVTSAESGGTIEYSTDGGSSWLTYSSSVTLSNSATYKVTARQTDVAGNVSESSTVNTIVVEKGDFLDKITADTYSGTYSVTKGGSVVGRVIFRKDITLPTGSTVTLNVKRKNSSGVVEPVETTLTKASSATISGGSDYKFTYTITEGDYIESNAALNVTDWSFSTVTYSTGVSGVGDVDFDLSYSSAITSGKEFTDNRTIYILTGNPSVSSAVLGGTVASDGTVSDQNLTVTFDRNISKVGGSITLELSAETSSDYDTFIAPAVMSASEYSSSSSAIQTYYEAGQNGATLNSDNTLTNDTTTKYILDFDTEPTNETLVQAFVEDGQATVTIPVVASAVTVSESILTVDLSSVYKLPIMGAKYKLTIPAGSVTDAAQNKNIEYTKSVTSLGVEPPVIRINKGSQEITPGTSPNYTTNSSVTMPATAEMRIDSQTPSAVIYWNENEQESSAVTVNASPVKFVTKTSDATVPTVSTSDSYKYSSSETHTLGENHTVSNYASASGLKIALVAYATSSDGTTTSEYSYEYATRTVLKLNIDGNYNTGDGYGSQSTSEGTAIYENTTAYSGETALKFSQLKVWVVGGDYTSGTNSITPFPLSWGDSSNFKLMASSSGFDDNMYGQWYWVTWDVTTATYHGFVVGNVPSDADPNGPGAWYTAEGGWDAQKTNYVLYPGETLIMSITSSDSGGSYTNGNYHWTTKNYRTR